MSLRAKTYIALINVLGSAAVVFQLSRWHADSMPRFACYVLAAMLTAGLKVPLPAITGTLSVNFVLILFAIIELNAPQAVALACTMTAVQGIWHATKHPRAIQVWFNVASMAIAASLTDYAYHLAPSHRLDAILRLATAAAVLFLLNTGLIAAVIALTEGKPVWTVWHDSYLWSFPYYLAGAAIAGLMALANRYGGWGSALLVIPAVYLMYRSYGLYLGRLEDERKHAQQLADLHLRTIETLALAIEAKDHTTHDHLERVQVYALEIGKELGLDHDELEALRAASLLHDIGKLAVPEHIISKPGRLTPEEFDKMKIHPVVGAEILERVQFPYPVVPIVRSHHERWDGSGYPAGLSGEQIPIGARILAAVDCLDALASDRQYRRALPLDEAMRKVVELSGANFDPRVVEVLQRLYIALEQKALARQATLHPLSTDIRIVRGGAPGAGFEQTRSNGHAPARAAGLSQAASQEVQGLFELAQDLSNSLGVDETLSVLGVRLRRIIPCDSLAIFLRRDDLLAPEYVSGDDFRLFSSLQIPLGQGLSGWVAENRRPIINGNPSVEPGYLNDPGRFSRLRSALAVPLEGFGGVVGVLSLYRSEKDAFTKDDLRILLAVSSKIAVSIENSLKYEDAVQPGMTDLATTLPNARSLFLHLETELSRVRKIKSPLVVLVCDLDHFRNVKNRCGPVEANRILGLIARGLKRSCRDCDYVAQMGGDEFVMVLPGITPEYLEPRLQDFRELATEASREARGCGDLTMSIGQAFFPADGGTVEELLRVAERRMYREKRETQIDVSPQEPPWEELSLSAIQ